MSKQHFGYFGPFELESPHKRWAIRLSARKPALKIGSVANQQFCYGRVIIPDGLDQRSPILPIRIHAERQLNGDNRV